ncbi:hypothetical protein BN1723_010455 [Verticillium longisporum]|uniref:Uncharacterized protein n=1 Tax=Verticillium longisporum TaxID=100787 RepID=A0A0G4KZ85_VERLO|nr:hypothetical protein BN1723_010455 [Verticillium longisporum]
MAQEGKGQGRQGKHAAVSSTATRLPGIRASALAPTESTIRHHDNLLSLREKLSEHASTNHSTASINGTLLTTLPALILSTITKAAQSRNPTQNTKTNQSLAGTK